MSDIVICPHCGKGSWSERICTRCATEIQKARARMGEVA